MRLSVFRLSIPRLSFDWLEGFGGRRFFLYALFTGLLFVIFAIVNFPYRAVVERALSELDLQPFRLEVAATRFAWFKGVELRGVQLTEPERSGWPLLESSQLYLRPGLGGLLRGSLSSVNANGTLYGGAIDVRWVGGEGMTRTALEFRGLQLARYRPLTSLLETGQVTGVLSGAATVEEPSGNPRAARAAGDLNLQGGGVLGAAVAGFAVPDLHFDTITLEFALQGGPLRDRGFRGPWRRAAVEWIRAGGPARAGGGQRSQPATYRATRSREHGLDSRAIGLGSAGKGGASRCPAARHRYPQEATLSLAARLQSAPAILIRPRLAH